MSKPEMLAMITGRKKGQNMIWYLLKASKTTSFTPQNIYFTASFLCNFLHIKSLVSPSIIHHGCMWQGLLGVPLQHGQPTLPPSLPPPPPLKIGRCYRRGLWVDTRWSIKSICIFVVQVACWGIFWAMIQGSRGGLYKSWNMSLIGDPPPPPHSVLFC